MKKGVILSTGLIVLGLILECLHLTTTIKLFEIKLWIIGMVCIVAGVLGLLWFTVVPVAENRADQLGNFKKNRLRKK